MDYDQIVARIAQLEADIKRAKHEARLRAIGRVALEAADLGFLLVPHRLAPAVSMVSEDDRP